MILDLGNYKVVTDDLQFIVQERKVVQEGRLTKKENVGKEIWKDVAYCSSLKSSLKFLSKKVLMNNEDINVVVRELKVLQGKIEGVAKLFELESSESDEGREGK
jgi:dTDP-glucose pyrophosphorylase